MSCNKLLQPKEIILFNQTPWLNLEKNLISFLCLRNADKLVRISQLQKNEHFNF